MASSIIFSLKLYQSEQHKLRLKLRSLHLVSLYFSMMFRKYLFLYCSQVKIFVTMWYFSWLLNHFDHVTKILLCYLKHNFQTKNLIFWLKTCIPMKYKLHQIKNFKTPHNLQLICSVSLVTLSFQKGSQIQIFCWLLVSNLALNFVTVMQKRKNRIYWVPLRHKEDILYN